MLLRALPNPTHLWPSLGSRACGGLWGVTVLRATPVTDRSWDPSLGFPFTAKFISAQVSKPIRLLPLAADSQYSNPLWALRCHRAEGRPLPQRLWEPRKPGGAPLGQRGGRLALQRARARNRLIASPCFLQTRGVSVESKVSLPGQAERRHHLMPGAQRELRTFISHSHFCTFSINNVEQKYVQSSLANSLLAPSVRRCCLQTQMRTLNLAFSHTSGFLGMAASGPWDSPSPSRSRA